MVRQHEYCSGQWGYHSAVTRTSRAIGEIMHQRNKLAVLRSFKLTMSMRTFNDLQTVLAYVYESTRGPLRRRSMLASKRLEKALKRSGRGVGKKGVV
jgi:hypothetical protein